MWIGAQLSVVGGLAREGSGCWSGRGFPRRGGRGGGQRRGGGGRGRRVNLHGQGHSWGEGGSTSMAGGSALEDLRNFVISMEAGCLDAGDLDLTIMGPAWKAEAPRGCSTREGGQGCAPIAR